jgi:hypothetical protein
MANTVQARLDEPSRKRLEQLVKRLGWSPSKIVREGLRLLAACQPGNRPVRSLAWGNLLLEFPTWAQIRNISGTSDGEAGPARQWVIVAAFDRSERLHLASAEAITLTIWSWLLVTPLD